MAGRLMGRWNRLAPDLRRRLLCIYAGLLLLTAVGWIALLLAARNHPILLGLGVLAFGFGLRHAVDPDHIAAIDNTTRKLLHDGKRPLGVGLFFSLGHSTVVFALTILVAFSVAFVHHNLPGFRAAGSVIGMSVSAIFLLAIAAINLLVLGDVVRSWRKAVRSGSHDEISLQRHLDNRGLLARAFRPLLRMVTESWNMYPIGFLFGLGFDTASEVGLLGLAAMTAAGGMPVWYILLLPLLFTAGMALVDTTDGVLMLGAYGWAQVRPVRKLYYNLNITLVSVVVALLVGGVEGLRVLGQETGWRGRLFDLTGSLPLDRLGFVIIAFFIVAWIGSVIVYKLRRYDLLDSVPMPQPLLDHERVA